MPIQVGGWSFKGPYSESELLDDPGVYVVLDSRSDMYGRHEYIYIDVGESSSVRTRVYSHDRKPCWRRNAHGGITYAVLYLPGARADRRKEWERAVRGLAAFPCGD